MSDVVWQEDLLGSGYQAATLRLGEDNEGKVVATLVRYWPPPTHPVPPFAPAHGTDVLYLHGWSDYFFQTGLAEHWHSLGARFHALDLRKYGRSLRDHQTPGYVADLATYDADIEAALTAMGHGVDAGRSSRRRPRAEQPVAGVSDRRGRAGLHFAAGAGGHPRAAAGNPAAGRLGFYSRSVSAELGGEWSYESRWRPARGFPAHRAWLSAVLAGHAAVAAGLGIGVPILTLLSARSTILPRWSDQMRQFGSVLVVDDIARAAVRLVSTVTVARIEGALHDVILSAEAPRNAAYASLTRWLRAYARGS
ncbi:alpha/beta hydrolase [Cryobacterium sp.]|jgi:alpha-beta hydrolase superfamily lysophospholipase|uniref:alpha/beta hydrolase n=1 Tax=Cryobacterium sp. TaxID=1926290 RepID=UPI00345CD74A|nr:alpha/beta hydrolase [Cryobacterium sp.]